VGVTIAVGYDGRAGARAALDLALGLLGRMHGKLLIIYLFDAPPDLGLAQELHTDGERVTKAAVMAAGARHVRSEVIILNRPIAEGLVEVSLAHNADMLVVGTHGESAFVGALLGSTCHKLVHCTRLPLVLVPPPEVIAGK
jgi:nucleotide-binding universal stress UspA family protein